MANSTLGNSNPAVKDELKLYFKKVHATLQVGGSGMQWPENRQKPEIVRQML